MITSRDFEPPQPALQPEPFSAPKKPPVPAPMPEPDSEPEVAPEPAPQPEPQPVRQSASGRRSEPTKRTRVIEVDEELHEVRDITAVRLDAGQDAYEIWDCPESPGEKIRINSAEALRFRNGNLECRDESDDAMVEHANSFAGGKYIRADPEYRNDPFIYDDGKGRTTRWHSRRAYERYVALHPRTS
jgi:hypothetical protein